MVCLFNSMSCHQEGVACSNTSYSVLKVRPGRALRVLELRGRVQLQCYGWPVEFHQNPETSSAVSVWKPF